MKTLLLILLTLPTFAQEAIGIQVSQDLRLALTKDDHGNNPFTADIQIKILLQGNDTKLGYLIVAPKYEYAQLSGGDYSRYGFEVGYSFHTGILKIDITPSIGYGYTYRWNERYDNFEYSLEGKLPLTKRLSFIALLNANKRRELPNQKFGYNVGAGLRFDIPTNYIKKQAEKGTRF